MGRGVRTLCIAHHFANVGRNVRGNVGVAHLHCKNSRRPVRYILERICKRFESRARIIRDGFSDFPPVRRRSTEFDVSLSRGVETRDTIRNYTLGGWGYVWLRVPAGRARGGWRGRELSVASCPAGSEARNSFIIERVSGALKFSMEFRYSVNGLCLPRDTLGPPLVDTTTSWSDFVDRYRGEFMVAAISRSHIKAGGKRPLNITHGN